MFVFFLGQARQTATKNIHFIIIHVAQTTDTDEHDQPRTVGGSQRHQRLQARTHKRDDQGRHRPDRALRIRIQDVDTGRQERGNQGLHAQSPILDGGQLTYRVAYALRASPLMFPESDGDVEVFNEGGQMVNNGNLFNVCDSYIQ